MSILYTDIAANQRDGLNFPGGGLSPQPGQFNDPIFELGSLSLITAVYVMTGLELVGDVLYIARIGQGVLVDPVDSSIAGNGVGTTASLTVGDTDTDAGVSAVRPARYSAAVAVQADMSATTAVRFAGGQTLVNPVSTIDDPVWVTATLTILTVPVAGKKLVFRIKLSDNR